MSVRCSMEEAVRRGWVSNPRPSPADLPADKTVDPSSPIIAPVHRSGKKRRRDLEGDEQATVIAVFDLEYPAFKGRLFHVANGGKRTRTEAGIFRKQGVRSGVPDLVLPVPVAPYNGLYIEMKAGPEHRSSVSADQQDWIGFLIGQGYYATVCRGCTQALDIIRGYLIGQAPPLQES